MGIIGGESFWGGSFREGSFEEWGEKEQREKNRHSWILAFCISSLMDCCKSRLSLSESWDTSCWVGSIVFLVFCTFFGLDGRGGVRGCEREGEG